MAKRKQVDTEEQIKMEGGDTDLSIAADEFLDCQKEIVLAQTKADEVEERLAQLMEDQGLKTMNHEGRKLTVRETNITRRSIVVGKTRTV